MNQLFAMHSYEETKLYKALVARPRTPFSESIARLIGNALEKAIPILETGGTTPLDFTLHDANHAYRVCERMADILEQNGLESISVYEIGFLILSAYLHDIGMTPNQRRVQDTFALLLTGQWKGEQNLKDEILQWIERYDSGWTIPDGQPTPSQLQEAARLTAHFCRHKHNDWSAEWIRTNLTTFTLKSYSDWISDLISVCQSHHWGLNELLSHGLDFRSVGINVNLRYLACVLRVADVVENDPERTPAVVFLHRNVSPQSAIYWQKDQALNLRMGKDAQLRASARPESAYLHKAVEETIDAIETELDICAQIQLISPLHYLDGEEFEYYKWKINPKVIRNILPRDGAYEYFDASFQPDTRRLLELISGRTLYATSAGFQDYPAIRELLQNSMDGVSEAMAYSRLKQAHPNDPNVVGSIAESYHIFLDLTESVDEGWILTCTDNGSGISREILKNRILKTGAPKKHEIQALEERCLKRGFRFNRLGRFGIGFLSYFMIADSVTVSSRRSTDAQDRDDHGWSFTTTGVGAFGELRSSGHTSGTTVQMKIKRSIRVGGAWMVNLRTYLERVIRWTPCTITLIINGAIFWEAKRGFTRDLIDIGVSHSGSLERKLFPEESNSRKSLLPPKGEVFAEEYSRRELLLDTFIDTMNVSPVTITLPNDAGIARLSLISFSNPEGQILGFLSHETDGTLGRIGDGLVYPIETRVTHSWRGIASLMNPDLLLFDSRLRRDLPFDVEICWESEDCVDVSLNRETLTLKDRGSENLAYVIDYCEKLLQEFLENNEESRYAAINRRLTNASTSKSKIIWIESKSNPNLREIEFPCVRSFSRIWAQRLTNKGKQVYQHDALPTYNEVDAMSERGGLAWYCGHQSPSRMVIYNDIINEGLTCLWDNPSGSEIEGPLPQYSTFPPGWERLLGASYYSYSKHGQTSHIWNPENPVVQSITENTWKWALSKFNPRNDSYYENFELDPLPHTESILADPKKCAAWLLLVLMKGETDLFEVVSEHDDEFMQRVFEILFNDPGASTLHWNGPSELRVISWNKCDKVELRRSSASEGPRREDFLPNPAPDFILDVTNELAGA
jgi:hypothetical protein